MEIEVINAIRRKHINTPELVIQDIKMELLKQEQAPCPVYHHFSPGLYVREINMAAGVFVVGHHHKTDHLNVFLKGKLQSVNKDGTVSMLEAPMLFTGPPGRKCCYIIEDVVWLNIFPTLETDIETLEEMFLDMSDPTDQVETPFDAKERDANRVDYKAMLREYALTEQIMRERSEITVDQIPFPNGTYSVGIFKSPIEGYGLFATADINIGDIIAPARIGMCRTPASRFVNHAKNPNAVMIESTLGLDLVAIKNIPGSRGGQRGAEITIDYRTNLIEREV